MQARFGLHEIWIPEKQTDYPQEYPQCNIFMTSEFRQDPATNKGKTALVLIQGTGAVRAGIWARSASINENFELGTMLPQLDWAVNHNKMAAIVLNPNCHSDPRTGEAVECTYSMQKHTCFVWDTYIKDAGFKNLLVIAHSAGGSCVMSLIDQFPDSFFGLVKQIAFTDTGSVCKDYIPEMFHDEMLARAVHYVASDLPLGTELTSNRNLACAHLSAGHQKHEYTTGTSWPLIQKQFDSTF